MYVVVRKWLARKHFTSMQQKTKSRNEKKKTRRKSTRKALEDEVLFIFFPDAYVL